MTFHWKPCCEFFPPNKKGGLWDVATVGEGNAGLDSTAQINVRCAIMLRWRGLYQLSFVRPCVRSSSFSRCLPVRLCLFLFILFVLCCPGDRIRLVQSCHLRRHCLQLQRSRFVSHCPKFLASSLTFIYLSASSTDRTLSFCFAQAKTRRKSSTSPPVKKSVNCCRCCCYCYHYYWLWLHLLRLVLLSSSLLLGPTRRRGTGRIWERASAHVHSPEGRYRSPGAVL